MQWDRDRSRDFGAMTLPGVRVRTRSRAIARTSRLRRGRRQRGSPSGIGHRGWQLAANPSACRRSTRSCCVAVSAFLVLDGSAARLLAWEAGLCPLVVQRISEPIGIMATVGQKPFRGRQCRSTRSGHRREACRGSWGKTLPDGPSARPSARIGCSLIGLLAEPESCQSRKFNGSRP